MAATYSIVLNNYRRQINCLMAELNSLSAERDKVRNVRDWDRITSRIEIALEALEDNAKSLKEHAAYIRGCQVI